MSFPEDIKKLRITKKLTQQELAEQLHVSRQTVSTWETGKNYPNLDTLRELSQLFDVSFEKLVFGENIMAEAEQNIATKVDKDLVKKGRYKRISIGLGTIVALLVVWVSTLTVGYLRGIPTIDRFNPFLSYTTAYTKLPSDQTISLKSKNNGEWTAWFTDNEMGTQWSKLTLQTGSNPGVTDPYVMVYHKGSFVKTAQIIPGKSVSDLSKSNLKALQRLENDKNPMMAKDVKKLKSSIHLSMGIHDSTN
ncbi:helix-turn-helix domain-containing protein [Fructobacillus ficulneus]|uniref:XRE family transcriptional regulator n=1 Tax=Fructobacillus ficulneus TaxID=157463 RepID=A0A0K8MHW7_9LACO|nr:helix-turn-helix transcriptional regulator [Fructobacillus ficulneus]GAP00033.1 XRE family transcriptional regulator [Fructobacillus ficulneus]